MWRKVGLLGRDDFLKKEIYRRIKGNAPVFVLAGRQGVGKTALLEWAFEHAEPPKAFISATMTINEILKKIVLDWGLEISDDTGKKVNPHRAKNEQLEQAIYSQKDGLIFCDDFHRATATKLDRLKVWNDRFKIFFAGTPPFKHEIMKHCLLGHSHLKIKPLSNEARQAVSQAVCVTLGSQHSPQNIALHSGGNPAKIISMARGDINTRESGEIEPEIDTGFMYLVMLVALISLRVIGRGIGDTALYLIGALVMISGLIFRFYIYRGMGK